MTQQAPLLAGKYRLVEPLGRGAMGVVWSAVNALTEREVALKLLADASDDDVRMRLLREARACGRIHHPNVIEVFDVGVTEAKEPFLVMQLLKGETLESLLRRETTPALPFALRLLRDIARGLAAAHRVDVVHRDLKPANVFLHREIDAPEPVVKLLDFGVSRIATEETVTSKGLAIGSPAYMAPEQALGQKVDVRTDMWAYGTVVFLVLTGRLPFAGRAAVEYLTAIVKGPIPVLPPVHPALDAALAELVARCFQRDIAARTITAAECASITDDLLKRLAIEPPEEDDPTVALDGASPTSATSEAIATAIVPVVRGGAVAERGVDVDEGAVTTATGPGRSAFRPVRKTIPMTAVPKPVWLGAGATVPLPPQVKPLPAVPHAELAKPAASARSSVALWLAVAIGALIGVVALVVWLTSGGRR